MRDLCDIDGYPYHNEEVFKYASLICEGLGVKIQGENNHFSLALPAHHRSAFTMAETDIVQWRPAREEMNRYDVAVALNVFDYLPEDSGALALMNILRSIKPGGYVLLSRFDDVLFLGSPIMQETLGYTFKKKIDGRDFDCSSAMLIQKDPV